VCNLRLRHPLSAITLALALAASLMSAAYAQSVAYSGSFGNKALLVVNGGAPRAIAPGETHYGVKLISANSDQATVEIKGKRLTVALGGAPSSVGGAGSKPTTVLKTDSSGHFVTTAQVNGTGVKFLVDTGATLVVLSREDADRAKIGYKDAPVGLMQTANGPVQAWRVKIDRLQVGEIEINNVDAVVNAAPLPFGLLGMSFLNRTEMRRSGEEMTLIKRF
jgi:aspartyl protease family protein